MANADLILRSKAEAKSLGLKWFFTGVACKNGHVAERMVSNNVCRECSYSSYTARMRRKGVPEGNWHGQSGTRLYTIWEAMKGRATRKYAKACYAGVTTCPEWQTFNAFWAWSIQAGYKDDLVIDRIDSSGNYEPSNCRWTTYTENNRNRKNVKLTIEDAREIRSAFGSGQSQKELAILFGIRPDYVSAICCQRIWKDSPS